MVGFWDDVALQGVTLVGADPEVKLTSFVHCAGHAVVAVWFVVLGHSLRDAALQQRHP